MKIRTLRAARPNWPRQLIRAAMATLLPQHIFLVKGSASRPAISLTFDDGPHPEYTPRLLDQLGEHQISATFFLIGREAELYPELVRRIVQEGHQLGNHTWHHAPPDQVSARALADEVHRTQQLLTDLTGQVPRVFRPPLGKLTPGKFACVWRLGLTTVLWSVDPKDYQVDSVAELRRRLLDHPCRSGDIVLMHDSRPLALEVIADLARMAEQARVEFVTISKLMNAGSD
jgi:peptidoglycan-N-acetylglucosamine deacetylase